MNLYFRAEFILIIILFFRVVVLLFKNKITIPENLVFLIYFLLIFLNSLFHELGFKTSMLNRLYNQILAVSLFVAILLQGFEKPALMVLIIIVSNIIFIAFCDIGFSSVLYVFLIFLLISKAIKLTRKSSKLLKLSPLYLILAIDVIFTLISFELSQFNVDWNLSKYINCVQSISLFVFFSDVILYHVYLRRFFAV